MRTTAQMIITENKGDRGESMVAAIVSKLNCILLIFLFKVINKIMPLERLSKVVERKQ